VGRPPWSRNQPPISSPLMNSMASELTTTSGVTPRNADEGTASASASAQASATIAGSSSDSARGSSQSSRNRSRGGRGGSVKAPHNLDKGGPGSSGGGGGSGGVGGRGRSCRGRVGAFLRKTASEQADQMMELSEECLSLLACVPADTTDPDPIIVAPFLDCRHTFLEMCQYRHYQFDTLRRAKHSSLMLLYHLHNPLAPQLRPICAACKGCIREVRWHCDVCASFDLCVPCYEAMESNSNTTGISSSGSGTDMTSAVGGSQAAGAASKGHGHSQSQSSSSASTGSETADRGIDKDRLVPKHPHLLTPYRVTFV
jgi:E1A/CREB-binding protein